MKCFYHTDMDGHCAGAIVKKATEGTYNGKTGFIPINYKDEFPFDSIVPNEDVYIVDFSLQKDGDFEKLLSITSFVYWIDHHKTAIEKYKHISNDIRVGGLQRDGISGCELTWEYFYGKEAKVPWAVKFLGDYDVWAFKYGDDTKWFQAGAKLYNSIPESPIWDKWLDVDNKLVEERENGQTALRQQEQYYASLIQSFSFATKLLDYPVFKVIACNAGAVSSDLFASVVGKEMVYDIMAPFVYDGKQWTVSLYTTNPDIDVSEIARTFGGGGHRAAAGFQCKELPFMREE